MTAFDTLSAFRSLSTISPVKHLFASPCFNFPASKGSCMEGVLSEIQNGIVPSFAFVESALKRERDVAIEYCVAAVP